MSSTPTPDPFVQPSTGLSSNVAGGLAYVTIIPAIIFLCIDPYRRDPFIRFHAFQSIFLAIPWIVLSFLLVIPIIGWILWPLIGICFFVIWVIAMVAAFQGRKWSIPFIGRFAEQQSAGNSLL